MRALGICALSLVAVLAGCVEDDPSASGCQDVPVTLFLAPDHALVPDLPAQEAVAGNGFAQAFLTDDMDVWLSAPLQQPMWILDRVTIELWARAKDGVAPIVIGGEPGQAYHFFNQFGSDRTFAPAYATEFAEPVTSAGTEYHYLEELQMPPGGFVIPAGESVRLLLTNLVMDGQEPTVDVLVGGETPSQVRFLARCVTVPEATPTILKVEDVTLPANQGLLTGAIPATDGLNRATVWFELTDHAVRLDFAIEALADGNPVKDDLDLTFVDQDGNPLWSAGSPYSIESGSLHAPNLRALFPAGLYGLQIDSYSGVGASVRATLTEWRAVAKPA